MSGVIKYSPRVRLPTASEQIVRSARHNKRVLSIVFAGLCISAIPMFFHWKTDKGKDTDPKVYQEFLKKEGFNPIHGAGKK